MSSAFVTLAGISWDPEIRGILTVALASALLAGTVWLLLVLNTGVRLGSMLALAGLFGWFTIMAVIWWLQGIGYTGDSPTWEYEGTFSDPPGAETAGIEDAYVANVGELPDPNCETGRIFPAAETGWTFTPPRYGCLPRAIALVMHYSGPDRDEVQAAVATVDVGAIRSTLQERNDLLDTEDPRYLDEAALEAKVAERVAVEVNRIDNLTLSALAAAAPQVIEWAEALGYVDLGDWTLLSTAESGEAAASAEAFVAERETFAFVPTTVALADGSEAESVSPLFVFEDAYETGGKPERSSDGIWARVANKISNSARITHPPHYAVIQARPAVPKAQVLGEAPPLPEPDRAGETFSIVMVRNLGDLRLVPALVAIGSGLIFLTLVLSLHWRDQRFRREQEALEGAAA
ncbi:MAG: hypothetical protein OXG52_09045 [bacterium]|nr:hypothetical protein [bacterium]